MGRDNEKLFSSIAAHRIVRPHHCLHALSQTLQYLVACQVPVTIIDGFEMIDVHDAHAEDGLFTFPSRQFLPQHVDNRGAIIDTAQKIVGGAVLGSLQCTNQLVLQIENPVADPKTGAQLLRVKWLPQVVVDPGVHSF